MKCRPSCSKGLTSDNNNKNNNKHNNNDDDDDDATTTTTTTTTTLNNRIAIKVLSQQEPSRTSLVLSINPMNASSDWLTEGLKSPGNCYSGIRAKTTKTEESFFVSKYGLIVLIFDIYDHL